MQFGYLPDDNNTQSGPATNVQARTTVLRSIYNLTKAVMSRSRVPVMDKPKPNCTVYKHVVYVKISETGSTMFFDVMRRFALKYSLARALPRFRMHFYGDENVALIPRPAKIKQRFVRIDRPQQRFDVMYHHMVFDGDIVSRVMPRDTFYVTMLRYPWAQFKSVLNKYNLLQKYAPGNDTAIELEQFLENPYKYWRNGSVRTSAFSRNGMMMELGFPDETEDVRNDDLVIQAYIKYLEQRFGLVMLVEFLDQSLILLRRMLCWEMEDILYTPMEGNNYPFKGNKDQKLISAHQKWSKADYAVYRHFKEKLLGLINKQPAEFHDEVLLFKRALEYVKICGSPSNVRILRRKGKPYASDDVINCSSQPVRKIT
ncbi:galactose-3-O-sulfotransferase 2 [Lingula anatina]|uniref:Galactose-3-O-sulfotransferase 2 n=1 Tax=Lingula anatina TaxID=7574 RepID=A0A1S3JKD7_LINAN|nr:galactose-3-O-sulfotransferase 2 [Lingula anatina]|eukprot:XP_013410885.1 galactose-3-O-sulfotransferase 2 [Lingula anatina]